MFFLSLPIKHKTSNILSTCIGGAIMTATLWILMAWLICCCVILSERMISIIKKRDRAHEALLNRVKRFRFYKMLKFLGVEENEYLHAVPTADINQQIHRCSQCKTLDLCDSCLRDRRQVFDLNFCPNYRSILEHSDIVRRYRLKKGI